MSVWVLYLYVSLWLSGSAVAGSYVPWRQTDRAGHITMICWPLFVLVAWPLIALFLAGLLLSAPLLHYRASKRDDA